jgi:hypothetical protein
VSIHAAGVSIHAAAAWTEVPSLATSVAYRGEGGDGEDRVLEPKENED